MEHLEAGSETPHAHDDLAGIRTALARVAMKVSGFRFEAKKSSALSVTETLQCKTSPYCRKSVLPRFSALPLVHAVRFGLSKDFSVVAV